MLFEVRALWKYWTWLCQAGVDWHKPSNNGP